MAVKPPDGTLRDWDDIAEEGWETLLLGNGLSINVWPRFGYGSLFDHAKTGGLTDQDRALFQGSPNFERVLGDLNTAIRMGDVLGMDTRPFYERYQSMQRALGHAIREVHLTRSDVPDDTLAAIRDELERHEWVFTTSYDLIVYWAMGYGERYEPFVDLFRGRSPCQFNPSRVDVQAHEVPVYFLHGALHLVVTGTGETRKLTRNLRTLLEQFGTPLEGDPQARPLLVTEGSARDKLRAIEGNAYLAHALNMLKRRSEPTVVFGSRLGQQDRHLIDALSENPRRPIAISMRPGARREIGPQQMDIFGRLEVDELFFFDATTHPLGSPELRAGP